MNPDSAEAPQPTEGEGTSHGEDVTAPRPAERHRRVETAAFLAVLFVLVFAWFRQSPLIYDSDSYYHLAVARQFTEQGLVDQLPLRASALGDGFGDKELGLHLYLMPFVSWFEPVLGAQLAITVLVTAILGVLALLVRSLLVGSAVSTRWAYALPLLLPWLSSEFAWRLVRLRAELGALLLLLVSLHCVVRRRERWLVLLGFLFAWSYTAWHAYLGLFGLIFLWRFVVRGEQRLQIALYPTLGVFAGLALHPHFPHNLTIWVLQSFDYFQGKAAHLDVGNEIQPHTTDLLLRIDGGFLLLALGLWLACRRAPQGPVATDGDRSLPVDVWGWAAAVFWVLFLLMARFSIYAFPFGLLWLLSLLAARGGFTATSRLGRLRIPLALVLLAACLAAAPETTKQIGLYRFRNHPGPDQVRIRDREELARRIPEGAHVAARWQQTPLYLWWAPQAKYLNVLDPIFTGLRENLEHAPSVRIIEADIRDNEAVRSALDGCVAVFHQAALTSVPRSVEEPELFFDVNAQGTARVIESARQAGVERFVFASSSSVYGDQEQSPKVESMYPDPQSPYAVSKLTGEYLLKTYAACYGMSCVSLRYFNIFGPRQRADSPYAAVIPKFADRMLRGEQPIIFGDGLQTRDYTFVTNAVNANLRSGATKEPLRGAVFNVACGEATDLLDLTQRMADYLGVETTPIHEPERVGEVKHSLADISAATQAIGYESSVSLNEGMARTLDAIRADLSATS